MFGDSGIRGALLETKRARISDGWTRTKINQHSREGVKSPGSDVKFTGVGTKGVPKRLKWFGPRYWKLER
jgi:hypothetical protein